MVIIIVLIERKNVKQYCQRSGLIMKAKNTTPQKMILTVENLTLFLMYNYDMTSANIPLWLLKLNRGIINGEDFENANDFDSSEKIYEILEDALTSLWLQLITNNEYGEIVLESNSYEAMRLSYIETVEQRMNIVYDMLNTPMNNILIKPFKILAIENIDIEIIKVDRTKLQSELAKAKREIEKKERQKLKKLEIN